MLSYIVKDEENLTQVLKNIWGISSRLIIKLKKNGRIFVNGNSVFINYPIKEGDIVEVDIQFEEESENIKSENIDINIVYEDDNLLVINKVAGMVVHPTCLHRSGTLANAVKYYLESKGENRKIRFVNRLDRDTSGIIVVAKNEYTQENLVRQMKENKFEKHYIAKVNGIVCNDEGTIDLPIGRKEGSIMERTIRDDGDRAVTHYKVLERCVEEDYTIVGIQLETGRTHQIRVHFKAIGHTLYGDSLYGDEREDVERYFLHAERVIFYDPIDNRKHEFLAKLDKIY